MARFIKHKQTEQWINKRRTFVNEGEEGNRRHIEFAKNLFISWDDDGSGLLEPHEIIKPLIGMGLSSDHNFAKKIIQALDPSQKGKVGPTNIEDLKISPQDFIKIFKSDKVSEQMVKIINQEAIQNKLLQSMEGGSLMRPPSQSYKISDATSPKGPRVNPKKVTVSLRNADTSSIIEIPLDADIDEI